MRELRGVRRLVLGAVPALTVAALATGCYSVDVTATASPDTVENGRPVQVCAQIATRGASVLGQESGTLEFDWDVFGAAPGGTHERTPALDTRPCQWHIYRQAGTYDVWVKYISQNPDAYSRPAKLHVTVTDPPDPQPFLTGYPVGLRDWAFSYRNRWMGSAFAATFPDGQLGLHHWQVFDADGTAIHDDWTSSADLAFTFPGAGTYTVVHTIGAQMDPTYTVDAVWVSTTDRKVVTIG